MRYLNDWIWLRLSNRYNVTAATHSLTDVYSRWLESVSASLGFDLVDFYLQRVPTAQSLNDAEYAYWSGGPLQDAVLWLDAQSFTSGHTTVPNLGSAGNTLDAQRGDGTTATTFPRFLPHTGTNYIYFTGGTTSLASTPHTTAVNITGAIDIAIRFSRDTATTTGYLVLKGSGYATRCYAVYMNSNGTVGFWSRDSGGTSRDVNSSAAISTTIDQPLWLRVTADPAAGEVKFFTAPDQASEPSSWTQLGLTRTGTWAASTFASNTELFSNGLSYTGTMYRCVVRDGIGGTVAFDANYTALTSGATTSFTESSANAATVTITRSSTGRKTTVVMRPVWLFGVDDYFEIADSPLLDFGATDSFTVMAVVRQWDTAAATYVAKRAVNTNVAGTPGYVLQNNTASSTIAYRGDNGTTVEEATATRTSGQRTVFIATRTPTQALVFADNTAGSAAAITAGDLSNSEVFRVGRLSGSGTAYADMELFAVAVWRRALTAAEVAQLVQHYTLVSI